MHQDLAIAILAASAVGLGAIILYQHMKDKHMPMPHPRPRPPRPYYQPKPTITSASLDATTEYYGSCPRFAQGCDKDGAVGGCEQYPDLCGRGASAVRMNDYRPGECEAFKQQCMDGSYSSCSMYNRACALRAEK